MSLHLWWMCAKPLANPRIIINPEGLNMLSGAGLCAAPEEGNEAPQTVATYYNPAYRPALEEELSSTDVNHAALSFRC